MRAWAVVVALVASLDAQATLFMPVDVEGMGADAERVKRAIISEASRALKVTIVELEVGRVDGTDSDGNAATCVDNAACIQKLIEAHDDTELVFVRARRTGLVDPWATVQLRIFDASGTLTFEASQDLSGDTDIRALMLRAFAPSLSTARLDIVGVVDGDVVMIDGLAGSTTSLLSAGEHQVQVIHRDGTTTTIPVTLAYDERRAVEVPAAPEKNATPSPNLALVAGGAVGVVGVIGVVASAIQLAALAPLLAEDERALGSCPRGDQDPTGNNFNNYGVEPFGACTAVVVGHYQTVQSQNDVAWAAMMVSAAFVVVGAAVGATAFLPDLATKDAE
jgi:hypothetical protein